jgi:hypothetical protein
MTHIRQRIRDEIFSTVTGLSITGDNVFKSRIYPLDSETVPGLIVFTGNEDIDSEEGRVARVQNRNLEVIITGKDKLTSGLDDRLDAIAEEVETSVLSANYTTIQTIDLLSIESDIEQGAEKPTGEITLTFSVHYLTRDGEPNVTF